jgi:magnesium transporter
VLTLFTVITTPIMIVGTWYGMNFEGIHEFQWKYGYLMAIGVTIVATAVAIWWFKKKGWFS